MARLVLSIVSYSNNGYNTLAATVSQISDRDQLQLLFNSHDKRQSKVPFRNDKDHALAFVQLS